MKTVNVVSTPNVQGNIGSCSAETSTIQVNNALLTSEYRQVQINSCTGAIINQSQYMTYEGVWGIAGVVVAALFFGVFLYAVTH